MPGRDRLSVISGLDTAVAGGQAEGGDHWTDGLRRGYHGKN